MKTLFLHFFVIIALLSCSKKTIDLPEVESSLTLSCEFLNDTIIRDYESILTESQDSFYINLWKSELLESNEIDSNYFITHFKNIHLSSNEWKGGITFRIEYLFTYEWLKYKVKDEFMIKLNSSWINYKHLDIPRDILLNESWTRYNIRNEINYEGTCKVNKVEKLLFKSCEEACQCFKDSSGYDEIFPERISLYVPGKLPRIDGYPYFIGSGIIDSTSFGCVIGYFNIINGEYKVWEDYCGPIN
ncbi:MAG: hypothetical protein V1779_00680 [bacterium]